MCLDDETKTVTVDGTPIALTPIEYNILRLLMQNPGRVYSSTQIYELVWNEPALGSESAVAVHIRHLREKIEIDPSQPRYLKVVWGLGYKMERGCKPMKTRLGERIGARALAFFLLAVSSAIGGLSLFGTLWCENCNWYANRQAESYFETEAFYGEIERDTTTIAQIAGAEGEPDWAESIYSLPRIPT